MEFWLRVLVYVSRITNYNGIGQVFAAIAGFGSASRISVFLIMDIFS